ncbi:MAG: hypothetical protein M3409_05495 [Gemmatimonadota bacterium]|jgi:hypothetical protein|nr:hypothetical protein [Gemmatimonadota bacterium]
MRRLRSTLPILLAGVLGCQPATPPAAERTAAVASAAEALATRSELRSDSLRLAALIRGLPRQPTVCQRMVREIARVAERHPADTAAFLGSLQDEFVGGTGNPFELEAGLREGRWNQRYFYAGHGGFRSEYDDAQRYPEGGNHQPGHLVSVFLVAARFGGESARVAIAHAGDYEPGDEDDLRLSVRAIEWGEGLRGGALRPGEMALQLPELCR